MSVLTDHNDLSLRIAGHFRDVEAELVKGSPEILNEYRKNAFRDFVTQGIPTRKTENYRYTNLQQSFSRNYQFHHTKNVEDFQLDEVFKCDVPQLDTHLVTTLNGWYYPVQASHNILPGNVILESLEKTATENPELLRKHYGKLADSETDPMVALNTAFARDGYFLHVPKNTLVGKPIQIINLLQSDKDSFATQRNLVIVEPGAEVTLILCDHTLNLNYYLNNAVTEIFVGENAVVNYYTVQNQHNHTTSINSVYIHQERNSQANTNTITLHGGLIRNNLKVILDGENGEANVYGMAFLDKKQHVDNFTQMVHAQPHCQSNQLYKNVLDDESTGAFSGRINVRRDAQKTNAFQRNNNLLLTDKALMQTKPQLIIEADDVKCSHGATIGQINEEALFYLRSRGIEEKQARLIMMNAFSYEVVQNIKVEPLRDRIDELIEKRLRGDVGRCHDCAYQCDC
jgi:Fe-S cluster assembly protein SufD